MAGAIGVAACASVMKAVAWVLAVVFISTTPRGAAAGHDMYVVGALPGQRFELILLMRFYDIVFRVK